MGLPKFSRNQFKQSVEVKPASSTPCSTLIADKFKRKVQKL